MVYSVVDRLAVDIAARLIYARTVRHTQGRGIVYRAGYFPAQYN